MLVTLDLMDSVEYIGLTILYNDNGEWQASTKGIDSAMLEKAKADGGLACFEVKEKKMYE